MTATVATTGTVQLEFAVGGVDETVVCVDPRFRHIASRLVGMEMPYGGMDWVQREGWEVRECIVGGVEAAIRNVGDVDPEPCSETGRSHV